MPPILLFIAQFERTLSYYLRHRDEVDEYLAKREEQAKTVRKKIERQQGDLTEIRARLSARKKTLSP